MSTDTSETYGLSASTTQHPVAAPEIQYLPPSPRNYHPPIGLIGCGGITQHHMAAYKKAGFHLVAVCDINQERALQLRNKFYPKAHVYTDYTELLRRADIEVVDIATHPHQRVPILEAAIDARKHILSQKPFVLDLDIGERLIARANQNEVKLAVNQNARWAPHFSYMRQAIQAGVIGDVGSVTFTLNFDHAWIAGTEFEKVHHIILYDFAIHWFDIVLQFLPGKTAKQVFGAVSRAQGQTISPPLMASVIVEFEGALVSIFFNGLAPYGQSDRTMIVGTKGTLQSMGPNLSDQEVTLFNDLGVAKPPLQGAWFPDGFHGSMGELLCAIEENREPSNSAKNNLQSLALAFAAMASADNGVPIIPGTVRSIL